jgi:hypothetical protein
MPAPDGVVDYNAVVVVDELGLVPELDRPSRPMAIGRVFPVVQAPRRGPTS